MNYLIDEESQQRIAESIDRAVAEVLSERLNHGSEEGLTPVLGSALMKQSFDSPTVSVEFNYRQLSKYTEESPSGADGGFLVRVTNRDGTTEKAALFQAKLLTNGDAVRELALSRSEAARLREQATRMLDHTDEAVALFYTSKQIYVVDAENYGRSELSSVQHPLSKEHRLITLGTYLGRWIPRCTRGDHDRDLIARISRPNGFKESLSMDVITSQPSISWKQAAAYRRRRRR